jgi:hypothetical protein
MPTFHRSPSESFSETVRWIMELFGVDNRMATLIAWDVAVTIGTDRHLWIDDSRAIKFIAENKG